MNFLIIVLAAPWLGHGRAVECFFAVAAFLQGAFFLFIPDALRESQATADLAWHVAQWIVALPFLVMAALTGTGLIFNILGYRYSRQLRFIGASLAVAIWTWISAKFIIIGSPAAFGSPLCICAALFSVRVMGMSLANLPMPGAPGAMGKI